MIPESRQCYCDKCSMILELGISRWRPLNRKYLYICLYMRWKRNSNGYAHVFEDGKPSGTNKEVVRHKRKWKSKMAAVKPEVLVSRLVHEIETKFQRLYPCFRGWQNQWH